MCCLSGMGNRWAGREAAKETAIRQSIPAVPGLGFSRLLPPPEVTGSLMQSPCVERREGTRPSPWGSHPAQQEQRQDPSPALQNKEPFPSSPRNTLPHSPPGFSPLFHPSQLSSPPVSCPLPDMPWLRPKTTVVCLLESLWLWRVLTGSVLETWSLPSRRIASSRWPAPGNRSDPATWLYSAPDGTQLLLMNKWIKNRHWLLLCPAVAATVSLHVTTPSRAGPPRVSGLVPISGST